jgi:F-type H+-transporting ATPase subunit a
LEQIGHVAVATITFLGRTFTYNPEMMQLTWFVMGMLLILGFLATKGMRIVPNKIQSVFELIVKFLQDITDSTLGKEDGKRFAPLIITLFMFILLSNWIGIVPNIFQFFGMLIALIHKLFGGEVKIAFEGITNIMVMPHAGAWYNFLFHIPSMHEPTKFLSTDLALAILVFVVVHVNAVKSKGIVEYFKGYMEPLPAERPWIFFFFLNPFFYLNIVGEIAKVVSHSFRLFGNIFGGGIIIIIVSELLRYFLVPVGLFAFFGLFAGLIQAFVFTMLAVTYIAVMK